MMYDDFPESDIVMKGGVASGIVYSAAIDAIAKRFDSVSVLLRVRRQTASLLVVVTAISVFLSPMMTFAQTVPSSQTPATGSAPASSPAGAGPSAAGTGSEAIESALLQYQGSAWSAARIAHRIDQAAKVGSGATIVIATTADVSAILELKVALAQGALIKYRVGLLTKRISGLHNLNFGCSAVPVRKPKRIILRGTNSQAVFDLPSATDAQTLVQTVASLGSVNESTTSAAGALSDMSLINQIAGNLSAQNVYVPSAYPPGLISETFDQTQIGKQLNDLEGARSDLYGAADKVVNNAKCQYMPTPKFKSTLVELTSEVTAASSLIDTFEASLFGGPTASSGGGAASGSPVVGSPPANSSTMPPPSTAVSPSSSSASNASVPLIQLISADYLLKKLNRPYYLVTVHQLESGGTVLTKTNLFSGSRVSYSGGGAATFAIYSDLGTFICSGISTDYRGFIDEQDIGTTGLGKLQPYGSPQVPSENPNKRGEFLPNVATYTTSGNKCPD